MTDAVVLAFALMGLLLVLHIMAMGSGLLNKFGNFLPKSAVKKHLDEMLRFPLGKGRRISGTALAAAYYLIIIVAAVFELPKTILLLVALLSFFVAGISIFLNFDLIFTQKVNCWICFLAQGLNIVIAALMAMLYFGMHF